jgi:hypothetical protein
MALHAPEVVVITGAPADVGPGERARPLAPRAARALGTR